MNTTPSLVDLVGQDEPIVLADRISRQSWLKVAVLGLLVAALYRVNLRQLLDGWSDPNWTFGYLIPFFSLYLLYVWRDELFLASRKVCCWGLVVMVVALLIKAYGQVVLHNNYIGHCTLPLMIWGLVLYLGGWRLALVTFVPIFYFMLAIPLPSRIYEMISLPMQNLAAKMAAALLHLCGVEISQTASYLEVTSVSGVKHPLTVEEACSGMRSLLGFFALGVAMAYVQERPFWQRLVLILGGIPIAIFTNVLRVAITATMFVIDEPELGKDFMHTMTGVVLMVPALLLLFFLAWILDSMYITEEDEEDEGADNEDASPSVEMAEVK